MKFVFLLLFFLFATTACHKNDIPDPAQADTLFPKPYLPIYPGSWWQYRDLSDSSLFTMTAGPYVPGYATYDNFNSRYFYAPTWNGTQYFGYGCQTDFRDGHGNITNEYLPLLKEEVGEKWLCGYIQYGPYIASYHRQVDSVGLQKIFGTDTFNNVIRVKEWSLGAGYGGVFTNIYYYAKDIGLIQKTGSSFPYTLPHSFRIENYYINH